MKVTNIFAHSAAPASGERFETIAQLGATTIKRIVSSDSPDPSPYQQDEDEWVLLIRGEATLEFEDQAALRLVSGDSVMIPAGTVHRVTATSSGALWLALHGDKKQ